MAAGRSGSGSGSKAGRAKNKKYRESFANAAQTMAGELHKCNANGQVGVRRQEREEEEEEEEKGVE